MVSQWAVDSRTGAPMPRGVFDAVQGSRTAFRSLDLQSNLVHAAFDLSFYGPPAAAGISDAMIESDATRSERHSAWLERLMQQQAASASNNLAIPLARADLLAAHPLHIVSSPADSGGRSGTRAGGLWQGSSSQLYHSVQHQYSLVPPVTGTCWHAGFTHLVTYAAGYYSYLYAQAFAASIWKALFAADPLSRAAGEAYRRQLLAPGAGADPASMISRTLGSEPTLHALVDELR